MTTEYKLIKLKTIADERGGLVALESNKNVPFEIKRVYYLYGTGEAVIRGYHAHNKLKQLAICVSGKCKFLLDNGQEKEIIQLDSVDVGLYMSGLIWREMFEFSHDCVLMVLADDFYNEADYIRDYNVFKNTIQNIKWELK